MKTVEKAPAAKLADPVEASIDEATRDMLRRRTSASAILTAVAEGGRPTRERAAMVFGRV